MKKVSGIKSVKISLAVLLVSAAALSGAKAFANCDCEQDDSGNWVAIHEGDNQTIQYFESSDECFQWVDTATACQD